MKQVALAITTNRAERLSGLGVSLSDLVYLENPQHTIQPYDPADTRFGQTVRDLLATRSGPEYPEAALVSLSNPDAENRSDDKDARQFNIDVRSGIQKSAAALAKKYTGWEIVSAAVGDLSEEQAIEGIAPAVDVYRDSEIRLIGPSHRKETLYVRELWRVGACWKMAELDVSEIPFQSRKTAVLSGPPHEVTYRPAVEFWMASALHEIKVSVSRRLQMFWISTGDMAHINRTPLSEIADPTDRLNGLKKAVDQVVAEWKLQPYKVSREDELDTPSWLFGALTGSNAESFAVASQWWSANRSRVILDSTGNALAVKSGQ
ncbi:MAG TPA: hypothetical protein VF980_20415 [Thermoanaerobaculia bacterium]